MNFNIRNLAYLGGASLIAVGLTACGGGGSADVTVSNGPPTGPSAVVSNYYDHNYLENVNGIPSGQASIVDYGTNATGGSVTFGMSGSQTVSNFTPSVSGGDYWGAPILSAIGFDFNVDDNLVPAIAMICNAVPNNGIGLNNQTSTDILVTASATSIFDPALLAGLQFGRYYQNCEQGNTIPASTLGNAIVFNVDGSATITVPDGAGGTTTFTLSAGQMNAALSGIPVQSSGGVLDTFTTFNAYRFVTASGMVTYALVEHGSNSQVNLTSGYVGLWLQ
jgi:hypothetical protein